MSHIISFSRRCHHLCLFRRHYLTTKYLYTPQQLNQLSRFVQTLSKKNENVFENGKGKAKPQREVINLKGPYKPPDYSKGDDVTNLKYHDPDTFGTLSSKFRTEVEIEQMPEEADDEVSVDYVNAKGAVREHNLEYAKKIARLIDENKITEALDVLDVEMKAVGARPANYIYTLLIGACGRIGNTQKAFRLYTQMRKRNLKVTAATYSGLLNACAMCRDSTVAMQKIDFLRDKMNKAQYDMNETNYNVLIKAFGRHKKLAPAFTVMDEMFEKKVKPSLTTFNFLLQACISDKVAGFRHALMTWHKIRSRRVLPDEYSYNLLLRACRDCGLGDEDATRLVIHALISPENRAILELEEKQKLAQQQSSSQESNSTSSHDSNVDSSNSKDSSNRKFDSSNDNCLSFEDAVSEDLPDLIHGASAQDDTTGSSEANVENRPNLISREPHLGDIVSVGEIKTAQDRLLLLGGVNSVLEEMSEDLVPPSIKTFTLLLDCIPNTLEAERQLLEVMKAQGVSVDTEWCNMLIKRRVFRQDPDKARDVLFMFQEHHLQPDLITFGCLALACQTWTQAEVFFEELNKSGYRLNKEMLGAMISQACHRCDLHYAEKIMLRFLDHELRVDKRVLQRLSDFVKKGYRIQEATDKGQPLSTVGNLPGIVQAPWWRNEFFRFARMHRKWLAEVKVEEETPYEQQFYKKRIEKDY